MTFQQLAYDHLFNNGMFEEDAMKVIELAKRDDVLEETMERRWNDHVSEYPPILQLIFIALLNEVAVKYIDKNMPNAQFRACFAEAE